MGFELRTLTNEADEAGTLALAAAKGARIASNPELDAVLQTNARNDFGDAWPCRSGTLVALKAPGVPFGETLERDGRVYEVPKKFQMKTNSMLVCNHPDFKFDPREKVFVPGKSVKCLPIPEKDGWYAPDSTFGIPNGIRTDSQKDRYLWRSNRDWFGLAVRRYGFFGDYGRRYVFLDVGPGGRFGVLESLAKGKLPKHVHEWETKCRVCGEVRGEA
ncbi:MAG: hypothetical protein M0R66_01380 [Candidatus Omnitrophica bacterium]|nr:hypothetical protein [Candidatus Omnitrophota bacterium]